MPEGENYNNWDKNSGDNEMTRAPWADENKHGDPYSLGMVCAVCMIKKTLIAAHCLHS